MKSLKEYIGECEGIALATPANTMGMGNPGITGSDTLTEPIKSITAKSKKEKLKKKIKESLLDDEEDLIKDIKEFSNNPFHFVATLINNDDLLIQHKQEIEKLFDKVIRTIKSKPHIRLIAEPRRIAIQHQLYACDPLIILRPGSLWPKNNDPYGFPGDQQLVVLFTEPFMEDYIIYGFKDETDYIHWIKMIVKKYNLKQSKKDVLVYYI